MSAAVTTRGGSYDNAVADLQALYDRRRVAFKSHLQLLIKRKTIRSKEDSQDSPMFWSEQMGGLRRNGKLSAETLFTALAEIGMDDESFTAWTTFTSKYETTPPVDVFMDYLKEQTRVLPDKLKSKTPYNAQPNKSGKAMIYCVWDQEVCGFCRTGPHALYSCQDFKAQTVKQRSSTV